MSHSLKPVHDKYWRLPTYEATCQTKLLKSLQARGFAFPYTIRKSELIDVQQRLDRGLLHYDDDKRLTDADLSHFITQRRLPRPNRACRRSKIAVLMGADEALNFAKFVDLPPELRERVYEFYLASLPYRLFCPTQPPIARASRLLRKEVLPLFYRRVQFSLRFYFVTDGYQVGEDISRGCSLRPCYQTAQFLQTLRGSGDGTVVRLDRVRVQVCAASMEDMERGQGVPVVRCSYQVGRAGGWVTRKVANYDAAKDVGPALDDVQDRVFTSATPPQTLFSLTHIYRVRADIETAFFETYAKCGDWIA